MGFISAIGKGLKYVGIGARTVARYSVGEGAEVISKARKAAVPAGTKWYKSIFSKDAAKAGWDALKKDVTKTATSKKGVWKSIKAFGKSIITKPQAGWRLARMKAAAAGQSAGFFTKLGGAFKGLGKSLQKMPIIGTIITVGCEIPEIYKAFTSKEGGAWEGIKQIGKSALKIAAGTALSAVGAAFLGPIGGIAGYMIGEWIAGKFVGGDFSENHLENEQQEEQSQGSESQLQDTQKTSSRSQTSQAQIPSFNTGFGDLLQAYNPSNLTSAGVSNPLNYNLTTGMNMNALGLYTPTIASTGINPAQNIFEQNPLGLKFHYVG